MLRSIGAFDSGLWNGRNADTLAWRSVHLCGVTRLCQRQCGESDAIRSAHVRFRCVRHESCCSGNVCGCCLWQWEHYTAMAGLTFWFCFAFVSLFVSSLRLISVSFLFALRCCCSQISSTSLALLNLFTLSVKFRMTGEQIHGSPANLTRAGVDLLSCLHDWIGLN